MKKMLDYAFGYLLAALAAGVFYREFTKAFAFSGRTALAFVHPHLFALGCLLFLLLALFVGAVPLREEKNFSRFLVLYQIGLPLTAVMLAVRGVLQVLGTPLSAGASAAISGIAGIGHLLAGIALVLLLLALRRAAGKRA